MHPLIAEILKDSEANTKIINWLADKKSKKIKIKLGNKIYVIHKPR